MDDKTMSAEERVRKITCYFELKYPVGPSNWYSECEPYLVDHIKEAETAAYERGREQGYAEGREEAARYVELRWVCPDAPDDICEGVCPENIGVKSAEGIRSLKPKVSEANTSKKTTGGSK